MFKKEIYPKTTRIGAEVTTITEKLDGSNLCIFKKGGELYFAQRKTVYGLNEIEEMKTQMYKGLYAFALDNGTELQNALCEGSVLCGEWISMGAIKYPQFHHQFKMFAKANIDDNFDLYNINYEHDLFVHCFLEKEFCSCVSAVPIVARMVGKFPTIEDLNALYTQYCLQENRIVEGFVVCTMNKIKKYVRCKRGKLEEHHI